MNQTSRTYVWSSEMGKKQTGEYARNGNEGNFDEASEIGGHVQD